MEGFVFINLSNGQKYRQSFLRSILLDFCPFSLSPSGQEQFVSSEFWLTKQVLCNVGPQIKQPQQQQDKRLLFFLVRTESLLFPINSLSCRTTAHKSGMDATRKRAECGQIYLLFESNKDLLQYLT